MLNNGVSWIPPCCPPWERGPGAADFTKQALTQFQPIPTSILSRKCSCTAGGHQAYVGLQRTQSTILKLLQATGSVSSAIFQILTPQSSPAQAAVRKYHPAVHITHLQLFQIVCTGEERQSKGQLSRTKQQHLGPTGALQTSAL